MNNNINQMDQQVNMNQNPQQGTIQTNPYINNNQIPTNPMQGQGIQNNPYVNQANAQNANVNADNGLVSGDFVKGALIGAGIAFLLTNKTTQGAISQGYSKGMDLFQAGVEELKERMEDAKAQMEAKEL